MSRTRKPSKNVRYWTEDFDRADGEVIEHNGNLTLVRDRETGEEHYLAPHEWDRREF